MNVLSLAEGNVVLLVFEHVVGVPCFLSVDGSITMHHNFCEEEREKFAESIGK